jgi:hypothetical protein
VVVVTVAVAVAVVVAVAVAVAVAAVVIVVVVMVVVVVVVVVVFNAKRFERITFTILYPIIIPQFTEFSQDLKLCMFGRSN